MMINKWKLDLLELAKEFTVKKEEDGSYSVCFSGEEYADSEVCAYIENNGSVRYYVTGVYNSGSDFAEIDITALEKLKEFCERMTGEDVPF